MMLLILHVVYVVFWVDRSRNILFRVLVARYMIFPVVQVLLSSSLTPLSASMGGLVRGQLFCSYCASYPYNVLDDQSMVFIL